MFPSFSKKYWLHNYRPRQGPLYCKGTQQLPSKSLRHGQIIQNSSSAQPDLEGSWQGSHQTGFNRTGFPWNDNSVQIKSFWVYHGNIGWGTTWPTINISKTFMPWSTKQILNPARKVAGVEDFSAYHGKHRGSLTDYSFALHFVLLLPLPEMHPRVFTGSGLSPKSFQPIPAGLCHSLLSSASTIFRLHFPGPSKPLS